jgi:hypothetical protein
LQGLLDFVTSRFFTDEIKNEPEIAVVDLPHLRVPSQASSHPLNVVRSVQLAHMLCRNLRTAVFRRRAARPSFFQPDKSVLLLYSLTSRSTCRRVKSEYRDEALTQHQTGDRVALVFRLVVQLTGMKVTKAEIERLQSTDLSQLM